MRDFKSTLGLFVIISIIFGSCQTNNQTIPEDLEGKRAFLKDKKTELRDLQKMVDELSAEIRKLDPPKENPAVEVNVLKLSSKEFKRFTKSQAMVVAEDVVNASSEIGGRILKLLVREGQYVKRGQLIAVTDMSTMESQIDEIKTSLSLANTVYERQKRLWDKNIGSEIQYLEAKSNKERLEQSLVTINSQINKKNVYAPISGAVDKEFLSQGETAAPGMPIIQILNTGKTKVVADLQESMLGKIKVGDVVEVYFPALDKTIKAPITMLGRTIDPANRTFKVEINLNSRKIKVKPNLLAEVMFNDFTESKAITIPTEFMMEEVTGNRYVYRVKDFGNDQRAEKTLIEIGESNKGEIIVLLGLEEGDQLITDGAKSISHNDLIIPNITNQKTADE